MAEFASTTVGASVHAPTDDNAEADASPKGYKDEVVRLLTNAKPALCQGESVGVIVDAHWHSNPPFNESRYRNVLPSEERRAATDSETCVDDACHADTNSEYALMPQSGYLKKVVHSCAGCGGDRFGVDIRQGKLALAERLRLKIRDDRNNVILHQLEPDHVVEVMVEFKKSRWAPDTGHHRSTLAH